MEETHRVRVPPGLVDETLSLPATWNLQDKKKKCGMGESTNGIPA